MKRLAKGLGAIVLMGAMAAPVAAREDEFNVSVFGGVTGTHGINLTGGLNFEYVRVEDHAKYSLHGQVSSIGIDDEDTSGGQSSLGIGSRFEISDVLWLGGGLDYSRLRAEWSGNPNVQPSSYHHVAVVPHLEFGVDRICSNSDVQFVALGKWYPVGFKYYDANTVGGRFEVLYGYSDSSMLGVFVDVTGNTGHKDKNKGVSYEIGLKASFR